MVDFPDGVHVVQVAVTVNNIPVVPTAENEVPAGQVGRYTGTSASYQTVAAWTVTAAKTGRLSEVSLRTSNYAKSTWKLVIGATTFMTDKVVGGALTLDFGGLALAAAAVVTLSVKSDGSTSITADGSIVGKEVG